MIGLAVFGLLLCGVGLLWLALITFEGVDATANPTVLMVKIAWAMLMVILGVMTVLARFALTAHK